MRINSDPGRGIVMGEDTILTIYPSDRSLLDLTPDATIIDHRDENGEVVLEWSGGSRMAMTLECLECLREPVDWRSGRFSLGQFSLLVISEARLYSAEIIVMRDGLKARLTKLGLEIWKEFLWFVRDVERRARGPEWRRAHEGKPLPLTSKISRLIKL